LRSRYPNAHCPRRPSGPMSTKTVCIFCAAELGPHTKPEHILLNALGGRKKTQRVICSKHNNDFGGDIDDALTTQVEVLRNHLQLESGTRSVRYLRDSI
jgi:HNH endonuclease